MGRSKKVEKKVKGSAPKGWSEKEWIEEQLSWVSSPRGILRWAVINQLKTETGVEMEWRDRKFLTDILCDMHPNQVIVKCTQVGLSTIELFKVHMLAKVRGMRIIYTLPTDKLLEKFAQTKIDPLMLHNSCIKPTGTETMTTKSFVESGGGYVIFAGTAGNQSDISLTADLIVADEADRSVLSVLEGLESRIMATEFKGQWWFTNPTRPNIGTDLKWQRSDKMEWHVTCPHCQTEQPLDYWQNIKTVKESVPGEDSTPVEVERSFFICSSCNEEWTNDKEVRRNGRWKATNPGAKWRGYHISQLCAAWITADEIAASERDKTKEYFYNYVLGLPVIGEGVSVEASLIMQSVVPEDDPRFKERNGKFKFMGVDVGSALHVCIGNEKGITKLVCLKDDKDMTPADRDNLESPKSKWGKLVQLMRTESINLCVVDNLPTQKQAEFQRLFPYKVYRCIYDYKEKRSADWEVSKDRKVINVHRTRVIDSVIGDYGKGELPIYVPKHAPWQDWLDGDSKDGSLTKHWEAFYVVGADGSDENIVKKDRMGNVIRTWENAGPDHFGHANVYWYIARAAGFRGEGSGSFMAGDFKGSPRGGKPKNDEEEFDDERGKDEEVGFYS